jgi:hypothetical protein
MNPDAAAPEQAAATPAAEDSSWQDAFAGAVCDPELGVPDGLRAANTDDLEARLAVYRNNALVPLVQSLEDSFPACRQLLGAAAFRALLIRFVRAHPPHTAVLQDYGSELPGFLALGMAGRTQPAVIDLARLELLTVQAWHAADADTLGPADFATALAQPERLSELRLVIHPAAALLESPHPVGSLWLAERRAAPLCMQLPGSPEVVLVTRADWSVQIQVLSTGEGTLCAALICGATLGQAMEIALADSPQSTPADLLATLISSGLCSALQTG